MFKFNIVALMILLALSGTGTALAGAGDVGTMAADFSLVEFGTGATRTLSQHEGEVVMLFVIGYG